MEGRAQGREDDGRNDARMKLYIKVRILEKKVGCKEGHATEREMERRTQGCKDILMEEEQGRKVGWKDGKKKDRMKEEQRKGRMQGRKERWKKDFDVRIY